MRIAWPVVPVAVLSRPSSRSRVLCLSSLAVLAAAGCGARAPITPSMAQRPEAALTFSAPVASTTTDAPQVAEPLAEETTAAPDEAPSTPPADATTTPPSPPAHRAFHEPTVPHDRTHAVVLLYHLLGDMETRTSITTAHFEEQMRWLVDNHIEIVTTAEIASYLAGTLDLPERVAAVTLDDGHITTYTRAFPILKKLGVRFTIALNTEAIEGHRPEAVTWNEVREMLSSGLCEIASHSHIHGHMDRLTDDTNRREVTLSRAIIEERTGVHAETFVFPFGGHNAKVRALVEEAGYRAAFAAWGGPVKQDSPRWQVPRSAILKTTTIGEFARQFQTADPPRVTRPAEAWALGKGSAEGGQG